MIDCQSGRLPRWCARPRGARRFMSAASDYPAESRPYDAKLGAAVAVTILTWASAFAAIRAGLTGFGPLELGALRFTVATVPATLHLAIARPPLPTRREF